ncbi:MAG: hypothetical protein ACKO3K_03555 [Cuspidothrix sp.]
MNQKIYAPNIYNFAFQLYQIANLDPDSIGENQDFIWETGNQIIHKITQKDIKLLDQIDVSQSPDDRYVDLLKSSIQNNINSVWLDFDGKVSLSTTSQKVNIKGFAYPLKLDDSYILFLNFRRPEEEQDNSGNNQKTDDVDVSLLRSFNPDNCLIYPEHSLFLGQTLLITGWLTGVKDKKIIQSIADECLKQVFPDNYQLPTLNHTGELFGSQIFEYGSLSKLHNYQHILIWLFSDTATDESFNNCYKNLINLFLFRTKIVKTYKNSREIHRNLDKIYRTIETEIRNLPADRDPKTSIDKYLTNLQDKLKLFPQLALEYSSLLRDLQETHNTIDINKQNYVNELKKISEKTKIQNTISDLSFLEKFINNNCDNFSRQIQADLGYFQNGSELLDKAINAIRGIVEIEQAKRDRSLETTVQILGIGFGGGAIVSGVIVQHIDKINQPIPIISPNSPPNQFYASLFLSIIATLGFTLIAMLGIWMSKRK